MRVPLRRRIPARPRVWSTSSTRFVRARRQKIVGTIRDANSWPEWQPEITRSSGESVLNAGDIVQGDAEMLGFKVAGRADITFADRNAFEQDVMVGIRMRVVYGFTEVADGTAVTHELLAELPRGLSGRILSLFLRCRLRRMQQRLLDNIERMGSPV
jgi:hypothetical protein